MKASNSTFRRFAAKLAMDSDDDARLVADLLKWCREKLSSAQIEQLRGGLEKTVAAMDAATVKVFPHSNRLNSRRTTARPSLDDKSQFPHANRLKR